MKNKELKNKVEKVVLQYISLFKEEYAAVVPQISAEREKNKDRFASLSFDKMLNRKMFEIPETLHNMITHALTAEEITLTKDGEDGKDFARWFAKRFPEFSASTHV